ncbi:cytochrome c [Shewanella schlegeliana]|uniref:Cytochrome c n=1 Tax=Shewanella schlegeliana TaxID=190308 RepID=A0ABS1SXY5_9GAMM|nr:cytochrome c [Shewanella schlegeliana]MBL4912156.1 cytochrome c [Shewanella schlegeliana]MCL1110758.1 cytochrome c [Shewanella schlegeliana]GIU22813.1 cytochrome c [Shewanella schlegeliana]
MKKTLIMSISALLATATLATSVQANNFKEAEDAIHYRQSAFSLIAYNFGDMGAMLKGKKEYNADVFAKRAENVAALSKLPLEGFVAGSEKGDTEALAKIWSDKADFDAKMKTFQENAAILAVAASKGDKKEIKKAFGNTGKSCKGCHDIYKKD